MVCFLRCIFLRMADFIKMDIFVKKKELKSEQENAIISKY